MKQIFNWTVGSFFRSIGRIIAYISIGLFIAYIMSANGLDVKDLFLDKVNASSFSGQYLGNLCYRDGANVSTCNQMSLSNDGFWTTSLNFTSSTRNQIKYLQFPAQVALSSDKRELTFQVKLMRITQDSESDITGTRTTTCYPHYIIETDNTDFEMYIQDMQCTTTGIMNSQTYDSHFSLSVSYIYNQNDYSYTPCYATGQSGDNFTIKCPVTTSNVSGLKVSVSTSDIDNSSYYLGVYPLWSVETETSQAIIDAQNRNTEAINNTITDTDTSSDVNSANSFFNENNETSAEASLQGIISSPLGIINNLITDGTSNPLCFTLNDKQICVPDGSIIWGNSYQSNWFRGGTKNMFISFFNLVVGGFLVYKMLLSLFRMVDDMLNPTSNRIEVMRL